MLGDLRELVGQGWWTAARSGSTPMPPRLQEALAELTAAHHRDVERVAVVVNTRKQAAELDAAIRERLVADGRVDDRAAVTTRAGQRFGARDRIATRRNDRDLGVANRDIWTVTAVGRQGELIVTPVDTARHAAGSGAGVDAHRAADRGGGHPLVLATAGRGAGRREDADLARHHRPDLTPLRRAALAGGDVQVLHRPRARGQDP